MWMKYSLFRLLNRILIDKMRFTVVCVCVSGTPPAHAHCTLEIPPHALRALPTKRTIFKRNIHMKNMFIEMVKWRQQSKGKQSTYGEPGIIPTIFVAAEFLTEHSQTEKCNGYFSMSTWSDRFSIKNKNQIMNFLFFHFYCGVRVWLHPFSVR